MNGTRWLCVALVGAAACTGGGSGPPAGVQTLAVTSVNWNDQMVPVGNVTTIVEDDSLEFIFGDSGLVVLAGGTQMGMDSTVTAWSGAGTVIPAAEGGGDWVVATDARGGLWRVAAQMNLEYVADRYGLADQTVLGVAAPGGPSVVFALPDGVAVSDGTTVSFYAYGGMSQPGDASPPPTIDASTDLDAAADAAPPIGVIAPQGEGGGNPGVPALAAAGGRVALVHDDTVRVFDPTMQNVNVFSLPRAQMVTFEPVTTGSDTTYRLVVATQQSVYVEDANGVLQQEYSSTGATIHGLVTSASNVWFAVGTELGLVQGTTVAQTSGANIPSTAALNTSSSGDVWVIASGQLTRFSVSADQQLWLTTVLPIFNQTCSQCHLPGGTSNYDLSQYSEWVALRPTIDQRVWVLQDMPPAGTTLSSMDRMTIHQWVMSGGM